MEEFLEMAQVPRVAVGHRSFEKMPDEFVGVEFGRIPPGTDEYADVDAFGGTP
jgi:hypothetical protein